MSRRTLTLAVLSGILLATSFPSIGFSFLAWFALVPFLFALRDQTVIGGLWLSGIFALVFFCGTVYWVTNSIHGYGHVPLVPAIVTTLLFSMFLALFIVPFGAAVVHIRTMRPGLLFLAAPALWVLLELARTHLFSGFPWALLGYSQYRWLPVIQIADITGVYGISFVIVLVNIAITELIENRRRYAPLALSAAILVMIIAYGQYRLHAPEAIGSVRIAVVQGNIEQDKKWDPSYQRSVIETYKRLTLKALEQKPELVIWPETATPFYFGGSGDNGDLTEDLTQFVRSIGTPLLTGSPTSEVGPNRILHLRNSAFLLNSDGTTGGVYHKLHLVPFGEYVPFGSVLFFVEKLVQAVGDFQTGTEHTVMELRSRKGGEPVAFSTVICYEIIFPDLVRRFVDRGARMLTTITNDAWFGRTAAPFQHFSMAVLRAVENRVPVARAANTGVSGFIDARGRVLAATGIFTEAYLVRDLAPAVGKKTFYTRYGDIFAWLCVLASIVLVALSQKNNCS
jgi:apolipoprotein N-acyltransferase